MTLRPGPDRAVMLRAAPPEPEHPREAAELHGRTVVPGTAEGEALVSPATISGWGGIDPAKGVIIERRHPLYGVCFTGKVLVFPGAKGSSGWAGFFQATRLLGTAPLAMVYTTTTTKAALGAVVTRVPTVTGLDRDPLTVIRTGDRVRVDADRGVVIVHPAAPDAPEPGASPSRERPAQRSRPRPGPPTHPARTVPPQ